VRLTAEDGYQAQHSYSIASAPDGAHFELAVERLDDGEVSPYLTDELRPRDQIELRGLRLVAVLGGEPDVEATLPVTPGGPADAPE
jgi:Oxidoreductase FAD-binding domain